VPTTVDGKPVKKSLTRNEIEDIASKIGCTKEIIRFRERAWQHATEVINKTKVISLQRKELSESRELSEQMRTYNTWKDHVKQWDTLKAGIVPGNETLLKFRNSFPTWYFDQFGSKISKVELRKCCLNEKEYKDILKDCDTFENYLAGFKAYHDFQVSVYDPTRTTVKVNPWLKKGVKHPHLTHANKSNRATTVDLAGIVTFKEHKAFVSKGKWQTRNINVDNFNLLFQFIKSLTADFRALRQRTTRRIADYWLAREALRDAAEQRKAERKAQGTAPVTSSPAAIVQTSPYDVVHTIAPIRRTYVSEQSSSCLNYCSVF
jgi:hypothetical protein